MSQTHNLPAAPTPTTAAPKLSHLDEYKTLREEITLYQHEIHRTWLWGVIATSSVYVWLATHKPEISSFEHGSSIWIIPPVVLFFCAMRYCNFRLRIRFLSNYLEEIEEDAFGQEKLRGLGHYRKVPTARMEKCSFFIALSFWFIIFACSVALSWNLSRPPTPPHDGSSVKHG